MYKLAKYIINTYNYANNFSATLWYTGHGERGTGNWCFKDGVITFEDIFGLYMDHMRGKRLTIAVTLVNGLEIVLRS